jgi:hypothetical protein
MNSSRPLRNPFTQFSQDLDIILQHFPHFYNKDEDASLSSEFCQPEGVMFGWPGALP